ncbi:MAG: hypothetical protein CFH21_00467 [Alphaproteobacteria bacterium MarineAlpha5_Bin11]|nr:MAG: hypothetical protein CFH21_00467 [Alphaproteobacteria bacterium MarineAlpha5_Bin11]
MKNKKYFNPGFISIVIALLIILYGLISYVLH